MPAEKTGRGDMAAKKKQGSVKFAEANTELMLAALAHEIKNPLNSIKGAGQYLNDRFGGNPEIKEFVSLIITEIDRLDAYLNEFLNFSRGTKLNLKPVNPAAFINGVIMLVKHGFKCEIETDFTGREHSLPDAMIDPEQMRQVIVNLLTNARDAAGDDARIKISCGKKGKNIFFSVSDNGKGISKALMKHIFTPFYTTKEKGMGIGLSICRAIVAKHGGKIRVKSEPGFGTAFTVLVPAGTKGGKNGA